MICAVINGPSWEEVRLQLCQAAVCADLVELRLDSFNDLNLNSLKKLRSEFLLPMIFTLRSRQQGGNDLQKEEDRLKKLLRLAALKPEYIDLEYHVPLKIVEKINSVHPDVRVILSYHHFSETPKDLDGLYRGMVKIPATYYKIAVTAENIVDALRLCNWARETQGNVIAISMGPHGQISRIIAPLIRSPIIYVSLEDTFQSAPGQLSAHILLNRYHYRSLNPQTSLYGLIGDPVELSISDETHNALIEACGWNAVYIKMVVKSAELFEFLRLIKQLPFKGLSVTIPLKESIIPHLDHVEDEARTIGAVNTLVIENGAMTGFNTDAKGVLDALEHVTSCQQKRIFVLGAGGAAKAVVYEAVKRKGIVTIFNRDDQKGCQLASRYHCEAKRLRCLNDSLKEGYDILINCTPLSPQIDEQLLFPQAVVMDIKTKPRVTPFLSNAMKRGCKVVFGYRMFVEQAVGQFALWFKQRINPRQCHEILEQEAEKALKKNEEISSLR